jgi:phytoene dehydrogenase-like protein
MSMFTQ